MSQIPIEKQVFDKNSFNRVVNTQFNQLLNNQPITETPVVTVDDFFILYEQLFYQIPKEGDINSHRFILQKEADYLGVITSEEDIQALLDEITLLRQQVLDTQSIIKDLTTTKTTGA
jgi:hypothetical protein